MSSLPSLKRLMKGALTALLFATVMACLAITIVPRFLDRVYYRGPVSMHFDGQRFLNPDGDQDVLRAPGGGSRAQFFWRYLTGNDGRAPWPAHVAVTKKPVAARVAGSAMVATWVGHATVLVQTEGLNILTDPIWSRTAGPFGTGPKRVTEPGIAFDNLPKIDLVLISHDHYDHLDQATLRKLWKRDKPLIVTSLGNDSVIGQVGVSSRALDWGGRAMIRPGVDVIITRSHHWDSRWFTDRNRALWSSFVVTLPGGNLFFAGDTGPGDLKWAEEAAAYGPIRLALLPIGAFRFQPGQMRSDTHIGPIDAAEIYRRLGASRGIAIHWGTFRLSYEAYDTPPRLLEKMVRCSGMSGFTAARIGQPMTIAPYAAPKRETAASQEDVIRCLKSAGGFALR
ncbi:MBL fold metallo-hydrolase [Sphingomonas sp.]|uniref:MBL fold metallo-hydrolase n=1 Tax=Sphingomonas sp. TaxID=28214 RepID=UPI003D6C7938